jgi:hypothetical protein
MSVYKGLMLALCISKASATLGGLRSFEKGTLGSRNLQSLGDWEICTSSNQCSNGCCSKKYSEGQYKCTPLEEGFVPEDNGCVSDGGGESLGDWTVCTSSDQCRNGCCSKQYSNDGQYKCTPLGAGFVPENNGCIASTQPGPQPGPPATQTYQLQLIPEEEIDGKILDDIEYAFNEMYSQMASKYNKNADTSVTIRIHEFDWDGVPAYADGEGVHIKTSHLRANPSDAAGVSIHELMHIVQRDWIDVPGWLIEGFADYARNESQVDMLMNNRWSIPDGYQPGTSYTDGYGTATSFIRFLDDNRIVGVPTLVSKFLDGSYSDADDIWREMAGSTLDELWELYASVTS